MASFISEKRVERDGFLIAYEGEVMSEAEAAKRGLLECDAPAAEPKKLKADWIAEAESLGLDTTGTVEALKERIEAFKADDGAGD